MKSKPIVFFGNERLATGVSTSLPVLKTLLNSGYQIKAIITSFNEGQSRTKRTLEIADFAKQNNIELIYSNQTDNLAERIRELGAPAAILAAHGQIISEAIINLFPAGIINIHPSVLPHYRGSTPIESTILNGDSKTGVSIMKLVKKMDAGPVYIQKIIELTGTETKQQLANDLGKIGAELLEDNLSSILDGSLQPKDQIESDATFCARLVKSDGVLSLSEPAEILERKVRAYLGYPKSTLEINGQNIIVTKAKLTEALDDKKLIIKCNPGLLEIEELIAQSGKKMTGEDFVRGYNRH